MNQVSPSPAQKAGDSWPVALRVAATIASYVFHPIFLVPLMGAYLVYWEPSLYLGMDHRLKTLRFITLVTNTTFYSLVTVLLARALGLIPSLQLREQRDRIIPYVITMFFYFWSWRVMRNFPDTPAPMVAMLFGVFLATSAGLVLNSFIKISMHTMGVGGLIMFFLLLGWQGSIGIGLPLSMSIFLGGLIYAARIVVSNHSPRELVMGFLVGAATQVAGFLFFH